MGTEAIPNRICGKGKNKMKLKDFVFPDLVKKGLHDLNLILQDVIKDLQKILNNGLTLKDNFTGQFVEVEIFSAGFEVNIENIYKKKIPEGYLVIKQNSGGIVYVPRPWTQEKLYFSATTAGRYKLFLF